MAGPGLKAVLITWKVSGVPYHTLIHGKTLLGAIYTLLRHLYGAKGVQNMAIFGSKAGHYGGLFPGWGSRLESV